MPFGRLPLLIVLAPLLLDGVLIYRPNFNFDRKKQKQITQEKSIKVYREIRQPTTPPTNANESEMRNGLEMGTVNSAEENQKQQKRWQQFKHDCFFTPVNCQISNSSANFAKANETKTTTNIWFVVAVLRILICHKILDLL